MNQNSRCTIQHWTPEPISREVSLVLDRIQKIEDVEYIAVMPDVHLAHNVCVGTVIATRQNLYPQAIGGDIGCGMTAIKFLCPGEILHEEKTAAHVFSRLENVVPTLQHRKTGHRINLPQQLQATLSHPKLEKLKSREGWLQFGTLGRGNHFLEFQTDEEGNLWLMVHSGSRSMGPAIRDHHLRISNKASRGLQYLEADTPEGQSFLADFHWASTYAEENRRFIALAVANLFDQIFHIEVDLSSYLNCQHNFVRKERHFGKDLWVHRKGAIAARSGERGIIPGSMGSPSYHVEGRGCQKALCSSSHGAGRRMSRAEARKRISPKQFHKEMGKILYDHRFEKQLVDEAPSAYKSIGAVMRAQRDLTKITRTLHPLLSYKGM